MIKCHQSSDVPVDPKKKNQKNNLKIILCIVIWKKKKKKGFQQCKWSCFLEGFILTFYYLQFFSSLATMQVGQTLCTVHVYLKINRTQYGRIIVYIHNNDMNKQLCEAPSWMDSAIIHVTPYDPMHCDTCYCYSLVYFETGVDDSSSLRHKHGQIFIFDEMQNRSRAKMQFQYVCCVSLFCLWRYENLEVKQIQNPAMSNSYMRN